MHPNTRRSIRWKGYDYAQEGAYYITICTDDRRHWFGRIDGGVMHRSPIGKLAQRCWDEIPDHMPHVDIGEFIVMPNHVHGIVIIRERTGDDERAPKNASAVSRTIEMPDGDMVDVPDNGSANLDAAEMPGDDGPMEMTGDHEMPGGHGQIEMPVDHDRPLRRAMPIVPVGSLGRIMRAYKSAVTRISYRDGLVPHGAKIWQRNYWDHVIRDGAEYMRITDYIRDNPAKWERDPFNRRR